MNLSEAHAIIARRRDDPLFEAVAVIVDHHRKAWEASVTNPKWLGDHGRLAGAAGALSAVRQVQADLYRQESSNGQQQESDAQGE